MGGIALHGLDNVGDQIGPPLELDVDVRPRLLRPLAQPHELVVPGDDHHDETGEDEEENDATEPHELPPETTLAFGLARAKNPARASGTVTAWHRA